MKGLSSLERIILECVSLGPISFQEVQQQTGLYENVCFNLLQALIIRGLVKTENQKYKISDKLPIGIMEEMNSQEARAMESLEMIEAILEQTSDKVFRFQKIALDERDEKIFLAMLSNMESFLNDAHKKSESSIQIKNRKVIFWGMGEIHRLMSQMVMGR